MGRAVASGLPLRRSRQLVQLRDSAAALSAALTHHFEHIVASSLSGLANACLILPGSLPATRSPDGRYLYTSD
jgi:hypothetical protein